MALGVGGYLRQPNIYGHIACMDVRKVQGADSIHGCKDGKATNIHVCKEANIHGSMQLTYMDARIIGKLTYMNLRELM